jgi:hypothetical protein
MHPLQAYYQLYAKLVIISNRTPVNDIANNNKGLKKKAIKLV